MFRFDLIVDGAWGSPENAITMVTAETRLVVDSLVSDHLLHLVHSLSTLDTYVLHHRSCSSLSPSSSSFN